MKKTFIVLTPKMEREINDRANAVAYIALVVIGTITVCGIYFGWWH